MFDENLYKLIFIGTITGIVASFVGGGAEILIVPLLIYLKVIEDYKQAIGTSLASLLLPIGILAVYFYNKQSCGKSKCILWSYAMIISFSFILGTMASYYSSGLDSKILKIIFASIMVLLGIIILVEEFMKQ
tara:strand:+ start:98 stop:493 length:396 start_codon:yes stop_codon:yes gene_type:complete